MCHYQRSRQPLWCANVSLPAKQTTVVVRVLTPTVVVRVLTPTIVLLVLTPKVRTRVKSQVSQRILPRACARNLSNPEGFAAIDDGASIVFHMLYSMFPICKKGCFQDWLKSAVQRSLLV